MGKLSTALRKYYRQANNSMIFGERYSLNSLSLRIWEEVGFTSIDPSVLSKVLSGKRLFTPTQLVAFSKILGISSSEKEYLFYCLNHDYLEKKGVQLQQSVFTSTDDVQVFIESSLNIGYELYFNGDCHALLNGQEAVLEFIQVVRKQNQSQHLRHISQVSELLYLQSWAIGCVLPAHKAVIQLDVIVKRLSNLHGYMTPEIGALIAYIECVKFYVSSEYNKQNIFSYQKVIHFGLQALSYINDVDKTLLAARKVVIAATRIGDHNTVAKVVDLVSCMLQNAPNVKNIAGLLLMKNSLRNSLVTFKSIPVQRFVSELEQHAKDDFIGKHTYAVSNMKDRVEEVISRNANLHILDAELQRILIVSEEEGLTKQRNKIIQLVQRKDAHFFTSLNIQT